MSESRESETREVSPFYKITPGGDTNDRDGNLVFSDFRPNAVPSDTPDESNDREAPDPKAESAPEPAPSQEWRIPIGQTESVTPVQPPAD